MTTTMKAYRITFFLMASCLAVTSVHAELTAQEIMLKANQVSMGDNVSQNIEMTLIDGKGRERVQSAKSFRRRMKTEHPYYMETRNIMFFTDPLKMNGTGFLSWDFDDPDKEDKQWLYLPSRKMTKRIAGNDKRLSFMGTDFSHADMAMRNVERYTYKMLPEEEIDGHPVWVIESTPINQEEVSESGYTQSIIYIRKDNFVVLRTINTLKKGNRTKRMDVHKLQQIDGIWVQMEVSMETTKAGTLISKTVMRTSKVKFDRKLSDDFFTVRSLEAGL